MITAMSIEGVYSPTFSFTMSDADAGGTNVQLFDVFPVMVGDPIKTPDTSGAASTYVQNAWQEGEIQGQIIGTSVSNYWTRRLAFADAVLPDQGSQTEYHHAVLKVTFSGQSQVYANVVTTDWRAPLEPLTPSDAVAVVGNYTWKFRNPYGYWRVVGTNAVLKA